MASADMTGISQLSEISKNSITISMSDDPEDLNIPDSNKDHKKNMNSADMSGISEISEISKTNTSITSFSGEPQNVTKLKKQKRMKIILTILLTFAISILIILAYIIFTVCCNYRENKKLDEYDKKHSTKIEIDGHMMNYKIVGENNNPTIIALPGFATFAPVIEFKSLAETLAENYRVVTVEPFGYGFSDTVDTERTIDNVVSELHQFTQKLGINQYYLMGHSIGGAYSLEMANRYMNETLGFIGLDCSVPGQEVLKKAFVDTEKDYDNYILAKKLGFTRVGSIFSKSTVCFAVDRDYKNMTEEEIEIVRLLAINRGYNKSIQNEKEHIYHDHFEQLKGKKFPESVPVLNFVNGLDNPEPEKWLQLHIDVITNRSHSEVIIIKGGHLLHYRYKDKVVNRIKGWII